MKKKAYAKINLRLQVINKRPDGYHNLQMLNTRINLYDVIDLELASHDEICFINKNIEPEFLLKVLNTIRNKYNIKDKFKIIIEKNIPLGAGLAGGSSDAAAIIELIDELYQLNLTLDDKIEISKLLGADIPYLFFNSLALVEGIGDKVTPIKLNIPTEYILLYPNIVLSTKEVFTNNLKYSQAITEEDLIKLSGNDVLDIYKNDLEASAFYICPLLKTLKNELSIYGKTWMSGSGSSILIYANKMQIDDVYVILKKRYPNYTILKVSTNIGE